MKWIYLSLISLLSISQMSSADTQSLEQQALERTGVAVVCASETTDDLEDLGVRMNKRLMALSGNVTATNMVTMRTNSRNNLCVSVTKK